MYLTDEGTFYWAHWGLNSPTDFNHKLGVSEVINFAAVGNTTLQNFSNDPIACSWSDGTPTNAQVDTTNGVFVTGETNGFTLTLPASTKERFLHIYLGVFQAQGQFVASLSGSNLVYTDASLDNDTDQSTGVYTIAYRGTSVGQTLTVTFLLINSHADGGSVTWQAITMQ